MRAGGEQGNTVVQLDRVRDRFSAAGKAEGSRLASLEQRVAELETEHAATERQLQVVEKELAVTSSDLENTHTRVNTLAQQLEDGQRLYLQTVQETQLQLRKQDTRVNWLTLVSVFALLLAAVACAILIWDVQKNAAQVPPAVVGRTACEAKAQSAFVKRSWAADLPASPPLDLPHRGGPGDVPRRGLRFPSGPRSIEVTA